MPDNQEKQVPNSVFRAIKSWLWSEGRAGINDNALQFQWYIRTYAVPVLSMSAMARWRASTHRFCGTIWDKRHFQGQAIRLQAVKTICQMDIARQHFSEHGSVIRKGAEHLDADWRTNPKGFTTIY